MKTMGKDKNLLLLTGITMLAGVYLAWQLVGLRFTNHDDIYFHLYSWVFHGDLLSFAKDTAYTQARLQALINMPIVLWVNNFGDSPFFDALNIGSFCIMYLSLVWMLSKLGSTKDSLALAIATLFLFPLHYYFTFPQGYPVMVVWELAFAFISVSLLTSHLEQPRLWKISLSAILFTLSLWGAEYNLVLHPALLIIAFLAKGKVNLKYFSKISSPYLIGWGVSVAIYLYFSIVSRSGGADTDGRVSFGLDFYAWLKTFLILEQKSFLPSGLLDGIGLTTATAQGSPEISAFLTFSSLWNGTRDRLSIAVIFVLSLIIFTMVLHSQKTENKSIRLYAILFACLASIPAFILAGSIHYQSIVLKGYLQGHLVSFYSQLGLSGLLFLLAAYLCNRFSKSNWKFVILVFCASILASVATVTFIYNNVNRQAMTANKQKWEAMHQLVIFVQSSNKNLKDRLFVAPDFWSTSGVSAIPDNSPFNGENYWSEYAKNVLHTPIKITNIDQDSTDNALIVRYFSTPSGIPVVVLNERVGNDRRWRLHLIASQPVEGALIFQNDSGRTRKIEANQWTCERQCVNTWSEPPATQPTSIDFEPDNHGPSRLLAQFMLPRGSEFGYPFGPPSKTEEASARNLTDIQIVSWGPQATTQGVIPNLQSDGSAGIWITFTGGAKLKNVQVIFNGEIANSTSVSPQVITASISAEPFKTIGVKEIHIKQPMTGAMLFVGKFNVTKK